MGKYKFAVVGMGPSGSILAAHLVQSGEDVVVVDVLLKHIDEISRHGLRLIGEVDMVTRFRHVYNSISMLEDHDIDVIFVATKTFSLRAVLREIRTVYRDGMKIVCYQNGIDNEELVARRFGRDAALRAVVNHAGNIIDNALIKMTFFHRPNYIGALSEESETIAKDVARIMTSTGLDTEYTTDIKQDAWKKTVLNAALSPISAITGQTMREVMQLPSTRALVESLLKEAIQVAQASGIKIDDDFFDFGVHYLDTAGHHRPSMLEDINEKRKTEIDYITGKIVEHGNKSEAPCPFNTAMINLIKGLESKIFM